jgi:hypothetical protein
VSTRGAVEAFRQEGYNGFFAGGTSLAGAIGFACAVNGRDA